MGRHHSARSAEEGDEEISVDGASDIAKKASEQSSSLDASAPNSSIRMSSSFLSDDVLYEQGHLAAERETCRMATEEPAPKWHKAIAAKLSARAVILTTGFIAIASFLVACWNLLSQLVRCSLMTALLVICALPLVSPQLVERALQLESGGTSPCRATVPCKPSSIAAREKVVSQFVRDTPTLVEGVVGKFDFF